MSATPFTSCISMTAVGYLWGLCTCGGIEEAMHLLRVLLLVAVGGVAVMLASAPSMAQTGDAARVKSSRSYPIDPITGYPIPPGRKLVSNRPRTTLTVSKRSYLDPGKESKPPGMTWSSFPADSPNSIFYDSTDW